MAVVGQAEGVMRRKFPLLNFSRPDVSHVGPHSHSQSTNVPKQSKASSLKSFRFLVSVVRIFILTWDASRLYSGRLM